MTPSNPISTFLQHGALPFAGRTENLDHLVRFAAPSDVERLRLLLILAEAGLGKSRMIEEAMPRLTGEGNGVVHVKLYPGSSNALVPLVARAVWNSTVGRDLLRREPPATVVDVIEALRRLCRLRRVVVILEDLHLLEEGSLRELRLLIDALNDEPLSIIALARPGEFRARSTIEGVLTETIELDRLDREGVTTIWKELFGDPPSDDILDVFVEGTRGVPLALRSALRGMIESGAMATDSAGAIQGTRLSLSAVRKIVRRSVSLLVEGMVAHLSDDLLDDAARLAYLGEIFSMRAAELLIPNARDVVERLIANGVLLPSPTVPRPLHSMGSDPWDDDVFVFTHTLLHDYLAEQGGVDVNRLLEVIARQAPIYSLLPVTRIGEHPDEISLAPDILDDGIHRIISFAWAMDSTSDWPRAVGVWEYAERLFSLYANELPARERRHLECRLRLNQLSLLRREYSDEYVQLIERFLELTADPEDEAIAMNRINGLSYVTGTLVRLDYSRMAWAWKEYLALQERFPKTRGSRYANPALASFAWAAILARDYPMVETIRRHVQEYLQSDELDEQQRSEAQVVLFPPFLLEFRTPQELEECRSMFAAVEHLHRPDRHQHTMRLISFLTHTGDMKRVIRDGRASVEYFRACGHWQNLVYTHLNVIMAESAFGMPLSQVADEIERVLNTVPVASPPDLRRNTAEWIEAIALLRGDVAWGREALARIVGDDVSTTAEMYMSVAEEDRAKGRRALDALGKDFATIDASDFNTVDLINLLLLATDGSAHDRAAVIARAQTWLHRPVLKVFDAMEMSVVAWLFKYLIERNADDNGELLGSVRDRLERLLQWLDDRELYSFMEGLLAMTASLLEASRITEWRERVRLHGEGRPIERKDVIKVSMIGSITVALPGQEAVPLKGVRIRNLLGLMIADSMLERPLSSREFIAIAGDDEDYELARKKRNMAVVRLREIIGSDAVITDGETPRLNLDRVDVDLLRVNDDLTAAGEGVISGSLARASELMTRGLELARGDVIFPTLYHEFFEAARDDFDVRLRSTILRVAQGLEAEEDRAAAEALLRRGHELLPDDLEIAEALRSILEKNGKKMEAARMKMAMASG